MFSLICLSLCSSFRLAGQSMSVVSRGRARSSLFLLCCLCGRTILCFPWVISQLLLPLTRRCQPCSQLVVVDSSSLLLLVTSELCLGSSNQVNRSGSRACPSHSAGGRFWQCSPLLLPACLADVLHPGALFLLSAASFQGQSPTALQQPDSQGGGGMSCIHGHQTSTSLSSF